MNPFIDSVRSPAARVELATQLRQQRMIGRYQFRKLLDGPVPFAIALRLIQKDFNEALRGAVRREMRRRRGPR